MELKISNSDPTLLVDEFGNPMFKCLSIHPQDAQALLTKIKKLEDKVWSLQQDLQDNQFTNNTY